MNATFQLIIIRCDLTSHSWRGVHDATLCYKVCQSLATGHRLYRIYLCVYTNILLSLIHMILFITYIHCHGQFYFKYMYVQKTYEKKVVAI